MTQNDATLDPTTNQSVSYDPALEPNISLAQGGAGIVQPPNYSPVPLPEPNQSIQQPNISLPDGTSGYVPYRPDLPNVFGPPETAPYSPSPVLEPNHSIGGQPDQFTPYEINPWGGLLVLDLIGKVPMYLITTTLYRFIIKFWSMIHLTKAIVSKKFLIFCLKLQSLQVLSPMTGPRMCTQLISRLTMTGPRMCTQLISRLTMTGPRMCTQLISRLTMTGPRICTLIWGDLLEFLFAFEEQMSSNLL